MDLPAVDWTLASRLGDLLVPPGPGLAPDEIAELVADLRSCAEAAGDIMAEATGLTAGDAGRVLVVDRSTWIAHNVDLGRQLVSGPTAATLLDRAAGLATGTQLGLVLPLVAQRVLGQFDPFGDPPTLLLVAPNVALTTRAMGVDPHAFRLWVCLHEVTHRLQFGQAPWLAAHLRDLMLRVVGAQAAPLAGWRPAKPLSRTLLDLVLGPDGREALDEVTAVMTLLEGHADVMMDRTDSVPAVAQIRARFQSRRQAAGLDAVVRAITGLDLKAAQYREGAAFCRHVIDRVGVRGLNRAFEGAACLPSRAEIDDPDLWLARTHQAD